jgi:hypothetical protein
MNSKRKVVMCLESPMEARLARYAFRSKQERLSSDGKRRSLPPLLLLRESEP